jgi:hypothetical protein
MIEFSTIILQFAEQGEKTGWTYIEVPPQIALQIKPNNKKSFRIKGMLDGLAVSGMALIPMGNGGFILPLKADVRKAIRKNKGATLQVKIEEDKDYKVEIPDELMACFEFETEAFQFFNSLPKSHRDYFIKWIDSAKTTETRTKRILNTVNAMMNKWTYNVMIKANR